MSIDVYPGEIRGLIGENAVKEFWDEKLEFFVSGENKQISMASQVWMILGGAIEGEDAFWELYNPENPNESPYGGTIVNSYCHAWSCTPAYFLRKYFKK